MIVKITKRFKDKNTKQWHEVDEELSVTNERYEEIKTACQVLEKKSAPSEKESDDAIKQKSTK